MSNWGEIMKGASGALGVLGKANPGIMQALSVLSESAQAHHALDAKTRELIALACAATTRCDGCIAIHSAEAVKAGATREELLEALAIAVNLNAGAATIYSSRILEAFDQFEQNAPESGGAGCCCSSSAKK
ncbi:MAG: carboxymuconolactone decarboxylase family protein [Deltaproteobacteria bacterium]|nr:carboxymuconolactone decarboxylase family protein [Deltaproteobacteria bacterium]